MSKIKKRFVRWGIFLSALFAPIVANALFFTLLAVGLATAVAGAIAYALWPEDGKFTKVMNAFQSIDGGCWFCKIFSTLFIAINNLTASLSEILITDCTKLLGLGLGFYILFKVLKAVISFGEIDPKQFFTDLLMPVLKCLVAMAVLANLGNFYEKIVNPLAGLSIGFATEISSAGQAAGLSTITQITSKGGTTTVENACSAVSSTSGALKNAVFGAEVNDAIQCFLKTSSLSLIQYMALGATFMSDSFILGYMKVFPHWSMLLVGLCLFVGTFAIFISFPFKLVDGMFRLMFVSALMPLWVILWVLPQTREYSKKAFDMFLNVLVSFIVLSVILLMVITILGAALGDLANNNEFWQLLMQGKTKDALEMIDWSTGTFFTMLAMTFLAFSLVGKTDSFVGAFVGGGAGGGMGGALEGAAMAGVAMLGSKVGKPIAKEAADVTGKAIGNAATSAGKAIGGGIKKMPYAAGYAVGAAKRGLHNLNSGPKMSARAAMTPTGMIPPTDTVKPKVSTSSLTEKLPDGKMKETAKKTFTDKNGKLTHTEVSELIKNAKGEVESKIQKRESFDVATGAKKGSTTIETRYNKDGTSTQLKTDYDAMGKKKSTLETTNAGTTKTEFDEAGRDKKITTKDKSGNTSVETNTFDSSGIRTSFVTESKDGAGKVTEHFKVDLKTNKKIDMLTGKVSDYVV